MILVWLVLFGTGFWLYGLESPAAWAVVAAVGLAIGLVLRGDGVLPWLCGFAAGIDLMLAAHLAAESGAGKGAVAGMGGLGAAVVIGSLVGVLSGR